VVRCDSAGNVLWAKQGGGTNNDLAIGLSVDAAGACYLTGGISTDGGGVLHGSASFDDCVINDVNFFLVKYSSAGAVLWCRKGGVFTIDRWPEGEVLRSTGDPDGNSYLLGQFYGTATFDTITLTNRGGLTSGPTNYPSYFVAKINADGNAVWAKQFGGAATTGNWEERSSIASDGVGHLAITGDIAITDAIFDDFILSQVGNEDVFVARLDADPPKLDLFHVGSSVAVSWPTNQQEFVLEGTSILPPTNGWFAITNGVVVVGTRNFFTNPITAGNQFYRLRKQ